MNAIPDALVDKTGGKFELNLYARWVTPEPDMVWVPRGQFVMGDNSVSGSPAAYHAFPTRLVTMDGFYIDKDLVTQDQYLKKMGNNPSNFTGDLNRPVEIVTWQNAVDYAKKDGNRLPTEAEWEYAARGGHYGALDNFIYSGGNNPDVVAWYNVTVQAQPVGNKATQSTKKAPNQLGILNMSGNVSEWCNDWFTAYTNLTSQVNNPQGPSSGSEKVRRGGAWSNAAGNVRVMVRNSDPPSAAHWAIGFRTAKTPPESNIK